MDLVYQSRLSELNQFSCIKTLKNVPEKFQGQFLTAFDIAIESEMMSDECELTVDDVCFDCSANHVSYLAKVSLGPEFTDEFTRFMYRNIEKNDFRSKQLIYYDHEQRSVDILRELYEEKKINLISYGDYPGSDEDIYGDGEGVFPGRYYERPGIRISEELFELFMHNLEYIEYLTVEEERNHSEIMIFAMSVAWNPVFFRKAIRRHPQFPDGEWNSFYFGFSNFMLENSDVSKESIYIFLTSVSLDNIRNFYKTKMYKNVENSTEELVEEIIGFLESNCSSLYRFLHTCIIFHARNPERFGPCGFLEICSGLPPDLQEMIVTNIVKYTFGKVTFRDGLVC